MECGRCNEGNEKGPLVLKTGESLRTGGRVVLGAGEDGSPTVKVWVSGGKFKVIKKMEKKMVVLGVATSKS